MKVRLSRGDAVYQVCIYVFVISLVLVCAFPLVYVVGNSFMSFTEWLERGNLAVLPWRWSLEGYRKVLDLGKTIYRALGVSIARTVLGTVTSIFFTLIAGYALSRENLPGRKWITTFMFIPILFNGGLIPTFLVIKDTGLYNNFWVFILPGLLAPWNALVFKQFFLNLPKEVEEAGYLDGASETNMLRYVIIPMSFPVIAALGLFTAVGHWNAWFDAMVYITDAEKKPLMLYLHNLITTNSLAATDLWEQLAAQDLNLDSLSAPRALRMCLSVLGILPILCVYPFLQKYFVTGMYVGAVKG